MAKKYIPTTMVWSGKIYDAGLMMEVPEDLEKAIDSYNQQEEDKQRAYNMALGISNAYIGDVPVLDENGLVIKPNLLVDPASAVDGTLIVEKEPAPKLPPKPPAK